MAGSGRRPGLWQPIGAQRDGPCVLLRRCPEHARFCLCTGTEALVHAAGDRRGVPLAVAVHQLRSRALPALFLAGAGGRLLLRYLWALPDQGMAGVRLAGGPSPAVWQHRFQDAPLSGLVQSRRHRRRRRHGHIHRSLPVCS